MGAVYFVEAPAGALLAELDHRERAGYERVTLQVVLEAGPVAATTWIAPPGNACDAGQLPLSELAGHVRRSQGPSGRNDDYVFQLERALDELDARDPFVSELSALLRER